MKTTLALLSTIIFASMLSAESLHQSDYSGQQQRTIKSLSLNDIHKLKHGLGAGMAKAAELNGVPGPMHVLEMKEKMRLTGEQEEKISAIFTQMRTDAKALGKEIIVSEKQLDKLFQANHIVPEKVSQKVSDLAELYGDLRQTHLQAHIATARILSEQQLKHYNTLRGYINHNHKAKHGIQ